MFHAGTRAFCLICLSVLVFVHVAPARTAAASARRQTGSALQDIVDQLRRELAIAAEVTAAIVAENPLLVSVEPVRGASGTFVMQFEGAFLQGLPDEELRAIVAHELGHVWIFTHHPYLQTERLANDIAMRVVSRESLRSVYTKVWARTGAKGNLARFLGPDN